MSWLYLWFNPCAFPSALFAHGTAGAVGARLPRALSSEREQTKMQNLGQIVSRERERMAVLLASPHHIGFQHRIEHRVRRRRDAVLPAKLDHLARKPRHLHAIAAFEIERHRGLHCRWRVHREI